MSRCDRRQSRLLHRRSVRRRDAPLDRCPALRDGLDVFLPVVARWFRATFGTPTPPQRLGWPAIAAGQNTLIFAPTGSGKTLAAFLACLDHLWRIPGRPRGVRILYISPLKALNQDISRNLEVPLDGILATRRGRGRAAAARSRSPSGAATPRPPTASGSSASRPTS